MAEPLLVAEDLRVDVDGVPSCDGLTFATTGSHVMLLGAPRSLVRAAAGMHDVVRGALTVSGLVPQEAVRTRAAAVALHDVPVPPKWSVLEYLTWSARLAGHRPADAVRLATDALGRMNLGPLGKTKLGRVTNEVRRATILAAALATDAPCILLEEPLAGLAEESARGHARTLLDALEGRRWIVFAARVPLTSPLTEAADEAIVATGGAVECKGTLEELARSTRRYVARVHGAVEALSRNLAERGVQLEARGSEYVVDLGERMTTTELLAACVEADVVVLELLPVARVLA